MDYLDWRGDLTFDAVPLCEVDNLIFSKLTFMDLENILPERGSGLTMSIGERELTVEVSQHIGDNVVRCIAMSSTDGLKRGTPVTDTGRPISVPVGRQTLGRIFNVLGDAVDNRPAPEEAEDNRLKDLLDEFLASAEPLDRKLFVGRHWYNRSVSVLAQGYGMTPNAVSIRLSRMREKLRTFLKERGYNP
jgi:hypothetical protein